MSVNASRSQVRRLAHHHGLWLLACGLSLVVAISAGSLLLALIAFGLLGSAVSLLWRDHQRLREAHDALLDRQELAGAAFELVDAGLIISGPDGVPVSQNAVSRAHIGSDITRTPPHTVALRQVKNADGELLQPNEKPISVALETGRVSKQRVVVEMPEGLATLEVSARRLDRRDGSVIGVVCVAHDISDILARKEELRRQTAKLQAMSTARAALLGQDDARPASHDRYMPQLARRVHGARG